MEASIIFKCDCGYEGLLYYGDPVSIMFGQMPKAVAQAIKHTHKKGKK
jgi:hypothetical protein